METKEAPLAPGVDGAFLRTLQTHQKGKVITDVSEAMRNVTAAVREHGKVGQVILKMTIYPATKGHETALGFECDVVEKTPRGEAFAGLFFADDTNNLVRENPHQQPLPALRPVGDDADEQPEQKENAV
jgi:hypothetical protein